VTRPKLTRIFWIGAAAILVAAALVAIGAITSGNFGETEAKILGTLFSLLLAGATVIAGLVLVERGALEWFGWTASCTAGVSFAIVAAAIWDEFDHDALGQWAGTAIALLVALLLVTTQRLLLRARHLQPIFAATAASAGVAVLATAYAIWGEDADGRDAPGAWETAAVFWILTVLGFLLLPVAQRYTSVGATGQAETRVLATLDDIELVATREPIAGVAVDGRPDAGERLVLRRRQPGT
jgi:hypothetical protein